MRKLLFLAALACAAWAWAQQAVLYVGSDWDEASAVVRAAWDEAGFARRAGVRLATVDQPEKVDAAVQADWKARQAIRLEPRAYPAFAYFGADGACLLLREGVRDPAALEGLLAEGRAREAAARAALEGGDAEAVGAALAPVVAELGHRTAKEKCRPLWDKLAALDPRDETGWRFAFEFDPAADACYKVQDFAGKKDYDGGEAYIRGLEAKPQAHLSNNQRQGLMLLRYVLYKGDEARKAELDDLLRRVLAMDATTHFGIAAQGLLCLRGQGPVAVPYGWRPKDARAGSQVWPVAVGVRKILRAPGRYELAIRRGKGRGTMTFEGLAVGGRRFGEAAPIAPGGSLAVPFDYAGGDATLSLSVAFDDPGQEWGTLALRRILPERPAAGDGAVEAATRGAWAPFLEQAVPEAVLAEIRAREGGAGFLAKFLADDAWLADFLGSGDPLAGWGASLKALDQICWLCPEVYASPTLRRWAAAAALNAGADPTEAVLLFQEMMALREEGFLRRGADAMRCDQMRYTLIPAQCDAANARWIAAEHNVPPRQYGGVCWAAPYRLNNFFGDSIHGSDYYKPWEHAYLRHEASRKVGAVCGGLSYYGSAAAKAHGLPSTTGGQPAHCAYLVWDPGQGRWAICYNVSPHTGSHFAPLADVWKFSYHELFADAFARPGMRESYRFLWQARARRAERFPAPVRSELACDAYEWGGAKLPDDPSKLKRIGSWRGLDALDLDQAGRKERVLLVWTGYLEAPRDLEAALTVRSDDGAGLWLDGRRVAGKDGLHGLEGSTHRATLAKGRHPFELRYFNNTGGRALEFKVEAVETRDPEVEALYRRAAEACPQNLALWRDWAAWLRAREAPAADWRALGDRAAQGLRDHVEPAWDFLLADVLPRLKALGGADAVREALVAWAGVIRQGPQQTAEFCDYGALLDAQAKAADGDAETHLALFRAALGAQAGTPDAFGVLMRWGGNRFLKDAALAPRYVAAVESLLSRDGDGGTLAKYVREGIRAASQAGNLQAFQALCDLQERLAPTARAPMDFGMEGQLLSGKGLLRLSSTSNWDRPDAYRAAIDARAALAPFHTAQERAPWAEVVLPGMAEVSGVYLQNRGDQNDGRLVPFTVEVSEDGKAWREVARGDRRQGDYRLTFPAARAKYVRVVCHPKDKTFLHLRKFCVFGKPLY